MKVLIIRFVELGDALITSSLCSTFKQNYPASEVHYLVYSNNAPIFKSHRDIDKVLTISNRERKNPILYFQRIHKISKEKYDIIIDATSTMKSEFISLYAYKSTPIRIGRDKAGRGFSYSHRVKDDSFSGDRLQQRLGLLKPLKQLGYNFPKHCDMHLRMSEIEIHRMATRMKACGVRSDKKVFVFAVSAKLSYKKWCLLHMRDVINHCLQNYDAQIVLFAGLPHEQVDVDNVYRLLNKHKQVFSNIQINSLREFAALLSNGDIFIGNEGGPRHIAHALGLPTATIFSPSSRKQTWLVGQGKRHQGIQWQDTAWKDVVTCDEESDISYRNGDSTYYKLYNNIKPTDFIPIVEQLMNHCFLQSKEEPNKTALRL